MRGRTLTAASALVIGVLAHGVPSAAAAVTGTAAAKGMTPRARSPLPWLLMPCGSGCGGAMAWPCFAGSSTS